MAIERPSSTRAPGGDLGHFWGYVASFGTLWGAFEVTLGSFLHALRLPLVGVLLASIGASLLVAQRQLCPRAGITLATAVIAAILKGFSPAGAIIGPMVAILMSGVLVELMLSIRPHALLSAAAGGFLAVAWSVFQPLLTHTILYGFRILSLYQELLIRLSRSLGISATAGWTTVGLFVALCCSLGGLAAVYGRWVGHRIAIRLSEGADEQDSAGHASSGGSGILAGRIDAASALAGLSAGVAEQTLVATAVPVAPASSTWRSGS